MPVDALAIRRSIDDTLRRVADGEDVDEYVRAAWYLLSMESSRRSGLDDVRSFFKYYLENYAWAVMGRGETDVGHLADTALATADVEELADYVRDHELRAAAALRIRRARGETV